jgi:outer membrane protein OmpA-like peptidoglycan-associated protein
LATRPTKCELNQELDKKACKIQVEDALKRKADSVHVDAEFAKRMHTEHVLAELAKKPDHSHIDDLKSELALKADKSHVDARAAYVDAELEKKTGKDFLEAQIAGLSKEARAVTKDIEVAMKEEIAFEASSANLLPAAKKIINKVAAVLKKHEAMKICIEGHTGCKCAIDPKSGSTGASPLKRNSSSQFGCKAVELSNSRAASVIEALKQAGCKNEMVSKGHGCVYRVGMAVKIFPAKGQ